MTVRQASTVADLFMSKTKSGFLIRFIQKRRGRLGGGGNGENIHLKSIFLVSHSRLTAGVMKLVTTATVALHPPPKDHI